MFMFHAYQLLRRYAMWEREKKKASPGGGHPEESKCTCQSKSGSIVKLSYETLGLDVSLLVSTEVNVENKTNSCCYHDYQHHLV